LRQVVLQGKPADKKLAQGKVPPFLLKIVGVAGPKTAFGFLKMRLCFLKMVDSDHELASFSFDQIGKSPS